MVAEIQERKSVLPLLPLRDVVVYPYMVIPLFVGREKSVHALESAMEGDRLVYLLTQKTVEHDNPEEVDLYTVGTIANILQILRLPDGTVKVLVEGVARARLIELYSENEYFSAEVTVLDNTYPLEDQDPEMLGLMRALQKRFTEYANLNKKIPKEMLSSLSSIEDPGRLADSLIVHLATKTPLKQKILETCDVIARLELVLGVLETEIELIELQKRIQGRVKKQMSDSQRRFYLEEKKNAVMEELEQLGVSNNRNEFSDLLLQLKNKKMPAAIREKAIDELEKLKIMPPMSSEFTVLRTYIDWFIKLPWNKKVKINKDLAKAEKVLEDDHYGLKVVKERILEYLAVQQRVKKLKGPILCLVGPPGVGKTSLGKSIAAATHRPFERIALGGVRDEAEIRGHRRTYVSALPGRVLQRLAKAKFNNPVLMLDEIDKMAMDFRGDPASALLEVLDPEQNKAFNDHYLEVDYDLSDVMFIATANSLKIPAPLLDRMEIIRIPGYTEHEKINIAERYLIPKQMQLNGVTTEELSITQGAIQSIIHHYTREAGVRDLEREISKICRKVVKELLLSASKKKREPRIRLLRITQRNIERYLGVKQYQYSIAKEQAQIGQVCGLAWTEVGGETLTIEAAVVPGKGKSVYTGRLGDVMQESIQAAMTVVRSRASFLGLEENFEEHCDVHVHVPEGATPKDGPSAGIAMCTALVSALTHISVRADIAMTGEITLRGEVLPIGGLKEKLLAALRCNIKTVIIPEGNQKDLKEIPSEITKDLEICPVQSIDAVLSIALTATPEPLQKSPSIKAAKVVKAKGAQKRGK